MLNDKKIIIQKSSKDKIDLCVINLFNTEFGKTYYPSLDFLKNILYKAMEKDFVYIAKYNEKIVGFIWFSKCNMFGEFPYLNLIFVFVKFRGIGIGTELLHFFETKVIEICKKPKLKLFLVVKDENHNAISFYEKNKYYSIGIIKGLFRASINEILMMKEINYKF